MEEAEGIDGDIVASKFKPSSEVSYKTTFGMIRMDRDNKPKYHGQFDDDIPPAETDDFSLSRNSTQTIDASNTLQYAGVTTMKNTSPSRAFENDDFLEESLDERWSIAPKSLSPKSDPAKIARVERKDSDLEAEKIVLVDSSKHPKVPAVSESEELNPIDDQFFGNLKNISQGDKVSNGRAVKMSEPRKESHDRTTIREEDLNEIDKQFFGTSLANVDFSELKVLPSEDLKPVDIADSDMNVFDQQLFGKVETNKGTQGKSEGVLEKKSPPKEDHFNTKGKTRKPKGHSAFDFINRNSTPVSEEVTSTNYDSRELKQASFQDIDILNHGIQKRLSRVEASTSERRKRSYDVEEEVDESVTSGKSSTFGKPDPKFLPTNLETLSSAEVQAIFNQSVVYNENDILAINKPYGLAMFGSSQRHRHSVESLLPGLAKSLGERFSEEMPLPVPVHRLDRITSGILIMAKTPEMHKRLTNLFRERKVSKQYWAILNGTPKPEQGIIQIPICEASKSDKDRFRMTLRPDYNQSEAIDKKTARGSVSPATTEYRVLAQFDNASLALVKPHTGVKHQIRVHLGFGLNTPILGDHKYSHIREVGKPQRVHGDILNRLGVQRSRGRDLPVYLHSKKIYLPADLTGKAEEVNRTLVIECGLPRYFIKTMKRLKVKPKDYVKI